MNKKVIIPLYAYDSWDLKYHPGEIRFRYDAKGELADIEKAMSYLDCGRVEDADMWAKLEKAEAADQNRNIDTKYFAVTIYKKGTCHLVFKDMALLKKFNLYCGRKQNWLPDDYGRKPYSHLDDEEREIVDSFEGQKSYEDTYSHQEFYLSATSGLTMIGA